MWAVCITSISHVLKLNGYGGPQAKVNEKNQGFKGWETLVISSYSKLINLLTRLLVNLLTCQPVNLSTLTHLFISDSVSIWGWLLSPR